MTHDPSDPSELDDVVEAFLDRQRRGERPTLEEYVRAYPHLADRLREVVPALEVIEAFAGPDSTVPAAPPSAADAPPARLGEFRILREVGRGGMGVVYEAVQESLGRHVALKVLPAAVRDDAAYLERFRREAQSAARLHHSGIVPVFCVGEEGGVWYYAMQYIPGQTLASVLHEVGRLRQGGPPTAPLAGSIAHDLVTAAPEPAPERAATPPPAGGLDTSGGGSAAYFRNVARIGALLAEALAYAHGQGVVHRDVKPANVLIDLDGGVWLTDFGLAKLDGTDELTRTGDLLGTLRFAAPEQLRGRAEPRSDVYSLGVTLYEMATLKPAFDDPVKARLVERVLTEEPTAPRRLDPRLPRDLETIILKASAKDPRHRYATAADLAADLRAFLDDRPIKARRLGPAGHLWRWCRRKPTLAASLGALVLLLVAVAVGSAYAALVFRDQEAAARKDQARSLLSEARALTLTRRPGQRLEALARLKEALALAGPAGLTEADRLAFRNVAIACFALPDVETVRTWPALDGDAHGWGRGFSFDARLGRYATSDMDGAVRVRRVADDAPICQVPGDGRRAHVFLSPDGTTLARMGGAGRIDLAGNGELTVWDVTAEPPRRLHVLAQESPGYAAFSPDSRRLAWVAAGQGVAVCDPRTGERVLVAAADLSPATTMAFSPDGVHLAFVRPAGEAGELAVCDAATGAVDRRFPLPAVFPGAAWHPAGDRLAVWDPVRLLVVDAAAGAYRPGLAEKTTEGLSATFDRGGELLLSSDWSNRMRVWDAATGRHHLSFPSVGHIVEVGLDGDLLATQNRTYDGRLRLLRLERGSDVLRYAAPPAGQRFYPEGRACYAPRDDAVFLAVGPDVPFSAEHGFCVVDARTGTSRATLTAHAQQPIAIEPDGALVTAGPEGVHRWPRHPDGDAVRYGPPDPLSGRLTEPRLSGAGGGVWTAYLGGTNLRVVRDGAVARADRAWCAILNGTRWPPGVSPDGRLLVMPNGGTARDGINARVYDTATGALVKGLPAPGLCAAAFSPGGGWVWAGNDQVRLWRTGTWTDGPSIAGFPLAFSPDDRLTAVGDPEGAIRLLVAETGDEVARLSLPGQERLSPVTFTADGGRLVALTERGDAALVWDLARTRARLAELGLDWPGPALPPADPAPTRPARLDLGAFALNADADRLDRERKKPEAIAAWRASLDRQPDQGHIHQRLARALYEGRPPDLAAALTHADRAVALGPSVAAHQTRALIREAMKDDRAALPDHDAALRLDPGEPSLFAFRAACRERLGDVAGALADARQAAALKPDVADYQTTVARLAFDQKVYRDAAAAAERALALRGVLEVTARWVLGLSRIHLGDGAQALPHLARVVEIQRGMPLGQIWLGLAIAQHHAGQPDAAKASHAKALAWRKAQPRPGKATGYYDDLLPLAEPLFGPAPPME